MGVQEAEEEKRRKREARRYGGSDTASLRDTSPADAQARHGDRTHAPQHQQGADGSPVQQQGQQTVSPELGQAPPHLQPFQQFHKHGGPQWQQPPGGYAMQSPWPQWGYGGGVYAAALGSAGQQGEDQPSAVSLQLQQVC